MDKQEIDNFVRSVFSYYNGKINIVNTNIELNICNVTTKKITTAGITSPGGVITLYPMRLYHQYMNDINLFKIYMIETIIHELHHTDQVVLYSKTNNTDYVYNIESCVNHMTISYMLCHMNLIEKLFNVKFNNTIILNYNNYLNNNICGEFYNRGTEFDHICSCIDGIFMDDKISFPIIRSMIDLISINDSKIAICINNNIMIIKDNQYECRLSDFNEYIRNNYFKHEYHTINNWSVKRSDKGLVIDINDCSGYTKFATVI